ncbi:helix-turn-helix transcriptional regulator [Actinophytocola sediminis]
MSLEDVVRTSGVSKATTSRYEAGKQTVTIGTVLALLEAYAIKAPERDELIQLATDSRDRVESVLSDVAPGWFARFAEEEATAEVIQTYQAEHIPGLLQTPAYCRAVTAANRPDVSDDELTRAVEFRRFRQQVLDGGHTRLRAIINEGALRRQVGGVRVMRDQLEHVRELAESPTIQVQVLPFSAGAHSAMTSFVILRFAEPVEPTIFVEVDAGAVYPDDIERYDWVWGQLSELALSEDSSTALLDTLITELHPGIQKGVD